MEENVNNNTEAENLSDVVDLEGINPVAKAIVLGVAGLATGGLVARKIIKKRKQENPDKRETKRKKEKEPKGKVRLRAPIYRETPEEGTDENNAE